jgi:uncharacterized protein YjiS (DUF1127 family)
MTRHFETSAPSAFVTTLSRAFRDLLRQIGDVLVALEHRREVKHLAELDERILKDIGLSPLDVRGALSEPFFRNPSVLLVRSDERRARTRTSAPVRGPARPTVPVVKNANPTKV